MMMSICILLVLLYYNPYTRQHTRHSSNTQSRNNKLETDRIIQEVSHFQSYTTYGIRWTLNLQTTHIPVTICIILNTLDPLRLTSMSHITENVEGYVY